MLKPNEITIAFEIFSKELVTIDRVLRKLEPHQLVQRDMLNYRKETIKNLLDQLHADYKTQMESNTPVKIKQ